MAKNDLPELGDLLVNHENRLNQLEYQVGILENRMPKSVLRRAVWFLRSMFWLSVPIVAGGASLFSENPWIAGAFAAIATKAIMDFLMTVSRGHRPHQSLLISDHR